MLVNQPEMNLSIEQMKKRARNFARLFEEHLKRFPEPTSKSASLEFVAQLDGYPSWHAAVERTQNRVITGVTAPGPSAAPLISPPIAKERKVRYASKSYCTSHLEMWNEALNQSHGMIVVGGISGSGVEATVIDICSALSDGLGAIRVFNKDSDFRSHYRTHADAFLTSSSP